MHIDATKNRDRAFTPLDQGERELLEQFARLEIHLDELVLGLGERLEMNFSPTSRTLATHFALPEPGIPITIEHLQVAMRKFEKSEIAETDLGRWAAMLLMNDAYDFQEGHSDELLDRLHGLAILPEPCSSAETKDY